MIYLPVSARLSASTQVIFSLSTADCECDNLFVLGQNKRMLNKAIGHKLKGSLPSDIAKTFRKRLSSLLVLFT